MPGAIITVTVEDEAGKANPNAMSHAEMAALLRQVGADPPTANALATALETWRSAGSEQGQEADRYRAAGLPYGPAGRRFVNLDEIGMVLGMPPALAARLMPHLSLYNFAGLDRSRADPVVAQAYAEARGNPPIPLPDHDLTVRITVQVVAANGGRFARQAIVLVPRHPDPGEARFAMRDWQ
jgi:general secretion pathway protein K